MKKRKQLAALAMGLFLAMGLSGCGGSDTSNKADGGSNTANTGTVETSGSTTATVLKIGHVNTETSSYHIGLVKFKELIEERTEGRYVIEVYANSQLGGERDMCEGVQMGTVDGVLTASTVLANFVPELMPIDFPYLIRDYEHADKVYLGDIGKQFMTDIDNSGFKCLAIWENGFRCLSNNKRLINSVDDVAGLKIRVMENKMHQELWRALGADATTMSWGDAYTAVQQGAVDGLEVPAMLTNANRVADICKYYAVTNHLYTPIPLIISEASWNKMSPEDQKIFMDTAAEVGDYEREQNRQIEQESMGQLEADGMTITTPDLAPFREKCQTLYEEYNDQYGEILNAILNVQ